MNRSGAVVTYRALTSTIRMMLEYKSVMKSLLYLFISLIGLALQCIASASEIRSVSFHSNSLEQNYVFNIYLPDGYETSDLRYPVLYLLHGNLGTEKSWVDEGNIQQTTDALIKSGTLDPMLIVIPADPKFWWADSAEHKAMTAFISDLMPHVENNFRTIQSRDGRAIAGYSAGGFGAANIALKYPELFAAAAPLSPAVYTPVPPATSSATQADAFLRNGEFDPQLWAALNWVSFIDDYKSSGIIVPFYINTGDHDRFDIAYHGAVFYQALREHQKEFVEFRVFDGDHNFAAWGGSVGDAMTYLDGFLSAPK